MCVRVGLSVSALSREYSGTQERSQSIAVGSGGSAAKHVVVTS
jgi:hypothetical protein